MQLFDRLRARAAQRRPIRVAVIGAGKFAAMYLAQARRTPGIHIAAVVDLDVAQARDRLASVGWPAAAGAASGLDDAISGGGAWLTDDAGAAIGHPAIEVVVEATGDAIAAVDHALAALAAGKHLVNVTVEADVLAGPELARRFTAAGRVYSLAYGDQPALIAEQVDWARTSGLEVTCAGKGTKYLPQFLDSTPETVWQHYGLTAAEARAGGMNARMFNSFIDGTKSAIEMAAVANACDLLPQPEGLAFPPCGAADLAAMLRPADQGGCLAHGGTVEVVSSLNRDGSPVRDDLRWGVFVVFEAPDDYVARCFGEYGLAPPGDRFAAMHKPYHLIGLELGVSVASVALRGEATGTPRSFAADAVAIAKTDLKAGTQLDGEGGATVRGRLMRAAESQANQALPIGLAAGARLKTALPKGQILTFADVTLDTTTTAACRLRQDMAGGRTDR